MIQASSNPNYIPSHQDIVHFPKGGTPSAKPNEWLAWHDKEVLEKDSNKVLVPFSWWAKHHQDADVLTKVKNAQIGVWFASSDDILKDADLVQAGKKVWPLVAAHFPIFRDGRSFSTAALLRDRFHWQGEIRAIGDVLIDQLLQGARVGFDSFALRPDQQIDTALKQFDLFSVRTQNSWRDKRSALAA